MRPILLSLLLLCTPALADSPLRALVLEYETGPAHIFQNEGRYGPEGTLFQAEDINQNRNLLRAWRVALEARLAQRHGLIFLYAPLDVTTRAALPYEVNFRGTVFPAGEPVDSRYVFEGFRASYVYRVYDGERLSWDVGLSVQVRNALVDVASVSGARYAQETDIGLVPALKTRLRYQLPSRVWVALEGDGLSTFGLAGNTTGGLYDVALTLGVPLGARGDVGAFARLRLVGGGADVAGRDIYNWANIGFAVLGVEADLVSLVGRLGAP